MKIWWLMKIWQLISEMWWLSEEWWLLRDVREVVHRDVVAHVYCICDGSLIDKCGNSSEIWF